MQDKNEETFYLENNYYGSSEVKEIEIDGLNALVGKKESFALFIYQPMCVTSSNFESILNEFLKDKGISIYKIAFSNIKNIELGKKIKYYPSFIIFNKGKIIDFLEADKDEDVDFYTSKEGFERWFTKYVKLKENTVYNDNRNDNLEDNNSDTNNIDYNITLDNMKKEKGKVNIYFFWGNGCPHCEEQTEFLESIKDKYGDKFNLYKYEVWYNKENANIMNAFASAMDDKDSGVPFTVIGEETFRGFNNSSKEKFIKAIEKGSKNNFDVYFDLIKNN